MKFDYKLTVPDGDISVRNGDYHLCLLHCMHLKWPSVFWVANLAFRRENLFRDLEIPEYDSDLAREGLREEGFPSMIESYFASPYGPFSDFNKDFFSRWAGLHSGNSRYSFLPIITEDSLLFELHGDSNLGVRLSVSHGDFVQVVADYLDFTEREERMGRAREEICSLFSYLKDINV